RPPTEIHDETIDAPPLADDELPGGARAGIFVHDLLERVPLETLRESAGVEAWRARADVRELLEATLRRHGRDPHQLAAAARMAHAALTARLPVVGGELAGLAQAKREAREVEFLFPFPDAAGGAERGYVKGFVDLLFEHQGRAYFGDWKTDRLPSWDPASVEAHVAKNYALQEQLYALALVRMLGIADATTTRRASAARCTFSCAVSRRRARSGAGDRRSTTSAPGKRRSPSGSCTTKQTMTGQRRGRREAGGGEA